MLPTPSPSPADSSTTGPSQARVGDEDLLLEGEVSADDIAAVEKAAERLAAEAQSPQD
jgi:hypothetical protein